MGRYNALRVRTLSLLDRIPMARSSSVERMYRLKRAVEGVDR